MMVMGVGMVTITMTQQRILAQPDGCVWAIPTAVTVRAIQVDLRLSQGAKAVSTIS